MKKALLLLGLFTFMLASCVKKIDGSSQEAMKSSIIEIKESMNDDEKKEFEQALMLVSFQGLNFKDLIKDRNPEKALDGITSVLDGMTAEDVITLSEEIKLERERQKREQARIEIEELYKAKEQADLDREKIKAFEVKSSKFYKVKKGRYYITEKPIIELTVKNGTNQPISRVHFMGTLSSPDRAVPYLKEDFNYDVSGGIESGEEVTWRLAPNMYSKWGRVKAPKDAILTLEVTRLDGSNGEKLYSIDSFDQRKEEKLNELLASYPEFKK
ncbi:MAG: DUF6694 family lipoprotein [Hyphomicrobiales bacterium]